MNKRATASGELADNDDKPPSAPASTHPPLIHPLPNVPSDEPSLAALLPVEPLSSRPRARPGIALRDVSARLAPFSHAAIDARFDRRRVRTKPPKESRRLRAFRRAHYPGVADADWFDWRWQSRNRIKSLAQLERLIDLSADERQALVDGGSLLPLGITPYYMGLLDPTDPGQPLRRTVIPVTGEFVRAPGEGDDPLGEDDHSPVPGLVHRYPDRVLLLALDFCTTYCRYCTRSRVVGHGELAPSDDRLDAMLEYIGAHPEIRDVLISGGDPLALSDEKLDHLLGRLRQIPHVEFIRIGTKMPAVLPQRITPSLIRVLRKHHPIWMSVHFLHPDECTTEAFVACARLADAGVIVGSQTVLLQGVNDDVETMRELMQRLLLMRVRPYYLYQCDPISGSSHFRTSIQTGLDIIEGLRGHTTGYAVPTYVVDAPGGGGKIPLQPNYLVRRDGDELVLRNYEGREYRYSDPVTQTPPKGRAPCASG